MGGLVRAFTSFFSPPRAPSPPPPAPMPVLPPPPPPPPAPPPPPEPPKEIDKSAEEKAERMSILARKRKGRKSTIMSGALGDVSDANSYKKRLLGD